MSRNTIVLSVLAFVVSGFGCVFQEGDELDAIESEVALPPPMNLTVVNVRPDRQDLSWTIVPGTVKHVVMRGFSSGTETSYTECCNAPENTFIANHLQPNTTYCWQVKNVNSTWQVSEPSNEVCLTTPADSGVVAPSTVTATPISSTRISVEWSDVAGVTKYYVNQSENNGPYQRVGSVLAPGTSFLKANLTPGVEYCYTIESENANGLSAASAPACATTTLVPAPATVSATTLSTTRIRLSWSGVSVANKYYVNRSAANGPYQRVGSVLAPTTTFDNVNLTPGVQYCYTIESENSDGLSAPSTPPACASTLPAGLEGYWRFDEAMGSVAVDSSGNGRNASLGAGASFTKLAKAPIDDNVSMLSISTGADGRATTGNVAAFRLTGPFSIALWAYVPASAPVIRLLGMRNSSACGAGNPGWELAQDSTGLSFIGENATASFGSSLPLGTWTHIAVTYAGGVDGAMRLYLNGVEVASLPYTAVNSIATSMAIGRPAGCAGGAVVLDELRILSRELAATEVATIGTQPPPPSNLMITRITSTVMDLSWTAPAGGADKWVILRGVGPTAPGNALPYTHAGPGTKTTFNGDHLQPATQYSWQVRTVKNGLLSNPSNEVVDTTLSPPEAPTGVMATAVSSTRINVSWNAVANATKYYVFMSTNSGPYSPRGSVLAPTTTLQIVNLSPNTMYSFQVQAEDAGLTRSAMSAPASATTPP